MNHEHIIEKVFVEITVNNKEKAYNIKDDISSFLSIDVFPEIEKYINSLQHQFAEHTLQIPRLELNLDIKNSTLNIELKDKIIQVFREEISEITKSIDASNHEIKSDSKAYLIENQEKLVQTFIYFLENGCMPWWNSDKKSISILESTVFESLISAGSFQKNIISVLSKQNVRERIINQLSDEQIAQLCITILKNKELKINLEKNIIYSISKLKYSDRHTVWNIVLDILSKHLNSSIGTIHEYLLQLISKTHNTSTDSNKAKNSFQQRKTVVEIFPFLKENKILASIENSITDNSEKEKTSMESISQEKNEIFEKSLIQNEEDLNQNDGQYLQNAGLILIHPFIKTFFEHCDLIHPKTQKLIDPELCAHLLHYIATGKTNAAEYDMVFEKFLCNIPINQSINKHIKLSHKHKTQAKNVIETVQYNWNPMKKSSVELLQNEFFQRSGKLVITDQDYTLTVERKTQDILLEKLGWGIGFMKLPWKEKFMFVNW